MREFWQRAVIQAFPLPIHSVFVRDVLDSLTFLVVQKFRFETTEEIYNIFLWD